MSLFGVECGGAACGTLIYAVLIVLRYGVRCMSGLCCCYMRRAVPLSTACSEAVSADPWGLERSGRLIPELQPGPRARACERNSVGVEERCHCRIGLRAISIGQASWTLARLPEVYPFAIGRWRPRGAPRQIVVGVLLWAGRSGQPCANPTRRRRCLATRGPDFI